MKIVDIAAAAGVSPSTVSRVISGSGKISPETASLVYRTMEEIGCSVLSDGDHKVFLRYSPSLLRRAAAVLTFGQFLPADLLGCAEMLRNLSQTLTAEGYSMVYHHFSDEREGYCPWMHFACGAVILQGQPHEPVARWLAKKPCVTINSADFKEGDHLLSGYNRVGQLAGQYLIDRGVSRFAAINAFPQRPEISSQIKGFRCFLRQNSINRYEELLSEESPFDASGKALAYLEAKMLPPVRKLLEYDNSRTGIFVPNDWMTALVYRLIRKHGGNPSDYLFISSGNYPAVLCGLHPRPATIDIGLKTIAQNAVALLLMRVHNKISHRPLQVALEPKIIPGERDVQ